jgi:putative CocE/NonD family hydrolase
MRDGITLNATVYRPRDEARTTFSCVLVRTPYTADTFHPIVRGMVDRGFACVVVDVRGRCGSGGEFEPFMNERPDGYDCVEWIAVQPWSDGDVFMLGGSYGGMVQWYAAGQRPPHLRSILPTAPAILGLELPFHRGIYISYNIQWLTLTSGATSQFNAFGDLEYWYDVFKRMYLEHIPYGKLDELTINLSTRFKTWTEHQHLDEYWDGTNIGQEEFARIDLPILSLSGLYDGALLGTIGYYRRHLAAAPPEAAERHYLVIGPWDHAGTRHPMRKVGGLSFGPQALLDIEALHEAWYKWTVGKGAKPAFLKNRVAYYVAGLEEWRYTSTIDEITTARRHLYLQSHGGSARDVFASGKLDSEPSADAGADASVSYVYDPLDTRPAQILTRLDVDNYLSQQQTAVNLLGNGVIYHTEPLAEEQIINGWPAAHLFISIDVPDTDLFVGIYYIAPDGRSITIGEDMLRTRYRLSLRKADFPTPGEIYEYEFHDFPFASQLMVKYSRLRVVVRCPNSPYEQKNYNSGGDVMWESKADAKVARVTVHQAAPHASYVILPLGDRIARQRLEEHETAGLFTQTETAGTL